MRALLISHTGIDEIQIDDSLEAMYDAIGCHTVCGAGYPDEHHACWADDEGLFRIESGTIQSTVNWYPQPLVGNLLVTGFDPTTGDTTPATLSREALAAMVSQIGVYL